MVKKLLTLAGIPDVWHGKNLGQLKSADKTTPFSNTLLRLENWDFKEPNIVFISGNKAGVGKTHISVSLFKKFTIEYIFKIINEYPLTLYNDTLDNLQIDTERFSWVKDSFAKERWIYDRIRSEDFDKSKFVESVMRKPIYVIDDLFADRETEFARSTMLGIIDERVDWHKALTIITSNYDLDYIGKKIDDRIASRLSTGISINITSQIDHRRL